MTAPRCNLVKKNSTPSLLGSTTDLRMNVATVIATLNRLLASKEPAQFNSSWIRRHAPGCYRFIRTNFRREYGGIDWDRLTFALERRFQRLWKPERISKRSLYEEPRETAAIREKFRHKIYVFIAPIDKTDKQIADMIGISFVRLAQQGNMLARRELCDLIRFTIDRWSERYETIARWHGHEEEMQDQIDGCIRRYRYTGSFLTYLFRTLECAGRGIVPCQAYSLDHRKDTS